MIKKIFFLKNAIIKKIIKNKLFIKLSKGKKKWIINAANDIKIIPFNIWKYILSGSLYWLFENVLSLNIEPITV